MANTSKMCEVKLFRAWHSPFVWRVDLALDLKGVKYEAIEEDLEDKSCELKRYSPKDNLKVPLLVHNDFAIGESIEILKYIEEVWESPPILPKDPSDRAEALELAKFIDEKCTIPSWRACWSKDDEVRENLKKEVQKDLEILENKLKGKKFFGGNNIGLVDFVGNFIAYWLPILQKEAKIEILSDKKFPKLCEWADRFCDHRDVKKHLPNKERLAAEYKKRLPQGQMYVPQFKRNCP